MDLMNVIIFSKDRPAQLDALLRSVRDQVEGWEQRSSWSVIHTASSPEFQAGYEMLKAEHISPALDFIEEAAQAQQFKPLVAGTMRRLYESNHAPWFMFLVDDMIFKSPWALSGGEPMNRLRTDARVLCLSLRLCPRYRYCYAEHRRVWPPFRARFGCWNWRRAKGDWGYPMSLDGHVFRYDDLMPLVESVEFRNPNSFEDELSKRPVSRRPLMTCYRESIVVNLPINRVQDEFRNRAGEQHGISAQKLNEAFLAGRRVDLAPVYALNDNRGCHHEMPLALT